MNRRRIVLGAIGAAIGGSAVHQIWLSNAAARAQASTDLQAIPVFDARSVGPVGHAQAQRSKMLALRDACIGPLTPAARAALHGVDQLARGWLHRSGSPYAAEVDAIAAIADAPGVHLLNTSYEWGCTALAGPAPAGDSARLLRTLDWPYAGLGRLVEVVRQTGPAGEFYNVTWPGAVGALTALAPGRFAASINQAPIERRINFADSLLLDAAFNTWTSYRGANRWSALHLLRHVFETAADYAEARRILEETPLANSTIFTLVGLKSDETCVIERTQTLRETRAGIASAANDWRYGRFPGRWIGAGDESDDQRRDSRARSELIETFAGRAIEDFAWVRAPILNGYTRLAVEMNPKLGQLRARGYEQTPTDADFAAPATLDLVLAV